jgi:TonB family protein
VLVQSGIVAGHILLHKAPVYPPEAKAKGIEGAVVLKAVIGKDGTVRDIAPVSGPEELVGAAIDAVQSWVYAPYTLNGEPTEVDTTIQVNFNLNHGPAAISAGVMAGRLIKQVQPETPAVAWEHHVHGTVVLAVVIDTTGHVREAKVVSGPMLLQQAALDAVKQWVYQPYELNGVPVVVNTTILVNFMPH